LSQVLRRTNETSKTIITKSILCSIFSHNIRR